MAESTIVRAILIDSSPIFRDGMRGCLIQGGHHVLSAARNLEETVLYPKSWTSW
jgi:hypothetical protein